MRRIFTIIATCGVAGFSFLFSAAANASFELKAGQLSNLLSRNFDRRCLTSPDSEAVRRLTVEPNGSLKFEKLSGRGTVNSDSDDFYREQSMWELSPVNDFFAGTQLDLGCNGKSLGGREGPCPELASRKSDRYVFMHFIPASAGGGRSRAWFSDHQKLLHSPENVVRLTTTKLHDPELLQFRTEWVDFFLGQENLSDSDVEKQATQMRKKYAKLFG